MIRFEHISKVFQLKGQAIHAVEDVSFAIENGDIFGVIGLSGAGKSTLVRCMNLLEKPTEGKVYLNDIELTALSEKELRKERKKIGMIFQQFNLLEQRTALKNVCYPLEIIGVPGIEAKEKAMELLRLVGLEERANSYPSQLSGGQKQRVAIARALATNPEILLCDEATSALDPNTTKAILDLLKKINKELGVTIVIITHEMKIVEQVCNKVAVIEQGKIVELGNVKDIFLQPKSSVARELIMPNAVAKVPVTGKHIYRITFNGKEACEPIIAQLILTCQAPINIWSASTENVGDVIYGQMVIEIPPDEEMIHKMKTYFDEHEICYEQCV